MWIINTALIQQFALAPGEDGEQTAPLGRAVIGGLAASTLAALTILSLVFGLVFGMIQRRASRASVSLLPRRDVSGGSHEQINEENE
jgi:hypothetical protein